MIQYRFIDSINLHVKDRVSQTDATRQTETAQEILVRLKDQPGMILADEVGMGKTFVALAVALSIAHHDSEERPVVVMVPPSLKEKWPRDLQVFLEKCLPSQISQQLTHSVATNALEFIQQLDQKKKHRPSIVFLTHGAMHRGLTDSWVKLAVIQRALHRRKNVDHLWRTLYRFSGKLLQLTWAEKYGDDIWEKLLNSSPEGWPQILKIRNVPHGTNNNHEDLVNLVPNIIIKSLDRLDLTSLFEKLHQIPLRESKHFEDNLKNARHAIRSEMAKLWSECLKNLSFKLPLLILDEAHHLKNPRTRFAELFQSEDSQKDAEELQKGTLFEVFERMLFLTATPFQLGHHELVSVLQRFGGISWAEKTAPPGGKVSFESKIADLRIKLDLAQEATTRLDQAWGDLRPDDLLIDNGQLSESRSWWTHSDNSQVLSAAVELVKSRFAAAKAHMRNAEEALRPWVIRHLKPKFLSEPHSEIPRRDIKEGDLILTDSRPTGRGLLIPEKGLLPFLLASRAISCSPESRPVFSEGLSSSFEAFLHTRSSRELNKIDVSKITDVDDPDPAAQSISSELSWYLDRIHEALPVNDPDSTVLHPKVGATVKRVLDLWSKGEKVVVFCHYVATGKALRQSISRAIEQEILRLGCEKLGVPEPDVMTRLDEIGTRFFDMDSPVRKAFDKEVSEMIEQWDELVLQKNDILEGSRRFVRTPSFLARFFQLSEGKLSKEAVIEALRRENGSGLELGEVLNSYFRFLALRCSTNERMSYITAIKRIQPGSHIGSDVSKTFATDEIIPGQNERLLPNVRLVNGSSRQETRQTLMLAFNTPFYPEVLIASSVMAEGVDLHLNCRHVIHHDLCWNPSTLEQRTGRVDRIGAKVELCARPVEVYLPYIGETQDEKMFRVVLDRERWFKVIMGEKYKLDAVTTEAQANRVPFPESAAQELMFNLEVRKRT